MPAAVSLFTRAGVYVALANVSLGLHPGHIPGFVGPLADTFLLQAADKRLGHGSPNSFPDGSCWTIADESDQNVSCHHCHIGLPWSE